MIRVKKISHAVYETPDLVKQTEYYTDMLGLARIDAFLDDQYVAPV